MWRRLFSRPPRTPVPLVLYTRPDCPLCDEMKHELARARLSAPTTLQVIDVEGDPALLERHGLSVPVLAIAGRPAFKGRLTRAALERKFTRRVRELARAPAPTPAAHPQAPTPAAHRGER